MAKANFKHPPMMKEDISYEDWKSDVEVWSDITDLEDKNKGGAVFLTLEGKARETVRAGVTRAEMKADDGLTKILTCLDELFKEDATRKSFNAFEHFIKFKRPSDMSMENFIVEFNIRYSKLKTVDMKLPEGVLAYYLLECANLSAEQENVCRATCTNLTYKDMREKIERVTANTKQPNTESMFYENHPEYYPPEDYNAHDEYQYDENYEAHSEEANEQEDLAFYANAPRSGGKPPYKHPNSRPLRVNAPDEYGNPSKCSFCKSIYHYQQECPDFQKKIVAK